MSLIDTSGEDRVAALLREGVEVPEGVNEYGMELEVDGQIVEDPALHLGTREIRR